MLARVSAENRGRVTVYQDFDRRVAGKALLSQGLQHLPFVTTADQEHQSPPARIQQASELRSEGSGERQVIAYRFLVLSPRRVGDDRAHPGGFHRRQRRAIFMQDNQPWTTPQSIRHRTVDRLVEVVVDDLLSRVAETSGDDGATACEWIDEHVP